MSRYTVATIGLLATAVFVAACNKPGSNNIYQQQLFAFGTLVELTFYGVSDEQGRAAAQQVDAMYQQQHRDWHAWQQGYLTDVNRAIAAGDATRTDPSIVELIQLGQKLERSSRGLFNPAIGKLLKLWGFQQDDGAQGPPPSEQAIQAWLDTSPSTLQLHLDDTTVSSSNPAVSLDFGGFAKGFSVGKAVQLLEQKGIKNLIVNAGGDLCVRGKHGRRPWRIGIRHPSKAGGVLASIELQGSSCVFTSGAYERFYEYNGQRYHHILDPRTGYPAQRSVSVTVLAQDPTLADAAATALFVAGPERWRTIAASMGVQDVLLVDDSDTAYITPALADHVHFEDPPSRIETLAAGNS